MTISTGNGFITTSDFKEILKEIEPDISEKDLTGMINEIDVDDSGTVDFEGLLKLNNKKKNKCNQVQLQDFSQTSLF